jgi:hypothetical protein
MVKNKEGKKDNTCGLMSGLPLRATSAYSYWGLPGNCTAWKLECVSTHSHLSLGALNPWHLQKSLHVDLAVSEHRRENSGSKIDVGSCGGMLLSCMETLQLIDELKDGTRRYGVGINSVCYSLALLLLRWAHIPYHCCFKLIASNSLWK